jgi:hypothetical protein
MLPSLSLPLASQSRQRPFRRPVPRPQQPAPTGSMHMRAQENRVVADVRFMPLQSVLEELAAWTGVVFEVESQENPVISIRLDGVPLEEAIRRITENEDSIFYYSAADSGTSRVTFVRVFSRAERNASPSLRYLGNGTVTRTEADAVDGPEQALAALKQSSDIEARQKAVDVLVESKDAAAPGALTQALEDPAPEVRAAAVEGLAALGVQAALPAVTKLLRDGNAGVRHSAVVAVSLLGNADNVAGLKPLLSDRDAEVSAAAEMAIRKLSPTRP